MMVEEIDDWPSNPTVDEVISALEDVKEKYDSDISFVCRGSGDGAKISVESEGGSRVVFGPKW